MKPRTCVQILALALLLSLVACASEEKGEPIDNSLKTMLTSTPELVADHVFDGFRLGSLRPLTRRLSETEGMGGQIAKELNRSRERYFNAPNEERAKLREEMKRDGIEGIIEHGWTVGVSFRLFGPDGKGAEELRTFFKGLGDHAFVGKFGDGFAYLAKNPAGGSLEMVVKKEAKGKRHYVHSIEWSRDDAHGPTEAPKGEPKK